MSRCAANSLCALRRVLLGGAFLLAGAGPDCLRGAEDVVETAPANPSALDTCELFPLGVGRQSIFKSGPLEVVERVVRHEKFGDELCARVDTLYDDKIVSYEHLAVRPDGVYRVAIAGKPVEPPLRFLKLPADPGSSWSIQSVVVGQTISGEFTLEKKAVKVAGQEVEAVVVDGRNFKAGKSNLAFTYYFVAGIGKVKQVVTLNGQATTLEVPELPKPGLAESAPVDTGKL